MRTTLTLDEDVHRAAQQMARTSGQPLGKIVSDLVRRGLERKATVVGRDPIDRRPVFIAPEGTPAMRAESIQRYLDEEGW